MKLTIEPSGDQRAEKFPHPTVSVSVPHDDVSVGEVVELFTAALKAMGFHDTCILDALTNAEL